MPVTLLSGSIAPCPRKGGDTAIRGVAVYGRRGTQRKYLPVTLPRFLKKIGKPIGPAAKIADPVVRRKRRNATKNSRVSFIHVTSWYDQTLRNIS